MQRLSQEQGWGVDGIRMAELGTFDAIFAALKVKQVDAMVGALEAGYLLEEKNAAKVLLGLEGVAPDFITHVVFAQPDLVKSNPGLVDRFLKGVFASIAFMKANKEKTTEIATKVLHQSPAVMSRTWDYEISMFEDDGHFDPKAIAVMQQSFIDMALSDEISPQTSSTRHNSCRYGRNQSLSCRHSRGSGNPGEQHDGSLDLRFRGGDGLGFYRLTIYRRP